MQTQTLVAYTLVAAVSVVTPGPASILAMRNGAAGGLRAVLPSSLGNVTGLFLLSAAAMLGLGVVLQSSALLFAALKVAGAAYLIYLGVRQIRTDAAPVAVDAGDPKQASIRELVMRGFLINTMNPKGTVFLLAVVPQFVDTALPLTPQYAALAGTLAFTDLVAMGVYTLLAARVLRLGAGERRVLCNAAHHANEWICTPLLLRFTEELCAAFAAGGQLLGQSAAKLLSEATLLLVPALNPDGIDLVTGELRRGEAFQTARRIAADYPRYPFPEGWKANIRGVDLNLQYPAGWDIARENKAALGVTSPAPADFVGPRPLSAPESRALYDATLAFSPDLTLSFHTQGAVIYWRYCGRAPEGAKELGEEFARLSGYALDDAPFASGFAGYKDWFVESFDRPGFTIEAGQGKNPLPLADFDAIYRENLPILVAAMSVE